MLIANKSRSFERSRSKKPNYSITKVSLRRNRESRPVGIISHLSPAAPPNSNRQQRPVCGESFMTNSQRLATVRDRLIRWLADQRDENSPTGDKPARGENSEGGPQDRQHIVSESILIRDGFYCGRRFDLGNHRAVWFLEEDELKVYDDAGKLVCVLSGEEIDAVDAPEVLPIRPDEVESSDQPQSDDEIRRAA